MELPADASSAAEARAYVRDALRGCPDAMVEAAELVVTELAANVVKHARTPMKVHVVVAGPRVRIEVTDRSPDVPVAGRRPTPRNGRGLVIVDRLADAWGVAPAGRGKTVWAELGRPAPSD